MPICDCKFLMNPDMNKASPHDQRKSISDYSLNNHPSKFNRIKWCRARTEIVSVLYGKQTIIAFYTQNSVCGYEGVKNSPADGHTSASSLYRPKCMHDTKVG